jgi:uncharacterized membrane protein
MLEIVAVGTFSSLCVAIVAFFSLMNDEPVRLRTERAVRRAWQVLFVTLALTIASMVSFFFLNPN